MTPATRLLNAARAWLASDPGGAPATPETHGLEVAVNLCAGVRALYPAAHAMGDRVSVAYPPEMRETFATQHCKDFTGVVTGVEFHTDGVDYRVTGDGDPDYTVVEAAFVHPVPEPDSRPVAQAEASVCDCTHPAHPIVPPSPSWFPMDGRTVHPRVAAQMHDMAVATGRVPTTGIDARFRAGPATVAEVEYNRAKELGLVGALRFVDNTPSIPILTIEPGGDTVTFGRNAATVNLTTGKVTLTGDVNEAARAFWAAVEGMAPKR